MNPAIRRSQLLLAVALLTIPVVARAQDQDGRSTWDDQVWRKPKLRAQMLGELGRLELEDRRLAGATLAIGYESLFSIHPEINELFYGNAMGVELRAHALESADGGPRASLLSAGLAFSSYYVSGAPQLGALRAPASFALLLPEVGIAFRRPGPTSFMLRWSDCIAYLVTHEIAIELDPSMTWLTRTPSGKVEVLWTVGLGVSWREID